MLPFSNFRWPRIGIVAIFSVITISGIGCSLYQYMTKSAIEPSVFLSERE